MEETLPQFSNLRNLNVNSEVANHLRPAMCWAKIIAIFGFVSSGIAFASAIVLMFLAELVLGPVGWIYRSGMLVTGIVCLCIAAVQFIACFCLLNASNSIKKAIVSGDNSLFVNGSRNLKTFFMISGIMTIISWVFAITYIILVFVFANHP